MFQSTTSKPYSPISNGKNVSSDVNFTFLPIDSFRKLVVFLFEDFNNIPYVMLHYQVITNISEFLVFYDFVFNTELDPEILKKIEEYL